MNAASEGGSPLHLAVSETEPGVVTIEAAGELDMSTCTALETECDRVLRRGPDRLLLDLVGIGFCGVTGIAALDRLRERCRAEGADLAVKPSATLRRALDLAAVAPLFRLTGPWARGDRTFGRQAAQG